MTSPTLGISTVGAPVPLDLDRLIETRLLVQGASGSGKSFAVRRLLEETHGRVQHLVLDAEGEYATLRERFDYVLAGPGGDCPAEPRHAGLLARRLLELGVSAIVDLHDMKPGDRPRFVRGFCETLIAAPRSLWHDALVVIEECHLVAPQGGREAESTNAVIDLATRGRKRGFALVAVTQRISDLHKSVVAQCGNRLIGLTTLDADVKRAAYELGFEGRDQARQLAELKRGHFFGFGPAISPRVIALGIGPVQTTHAQRRGSRAAPPPPAPEKVRAILGKLADLPREAEEEVRTVESLGRRVRELEGELRKARAGAPDPEAIERARAEGAEQRRGEAWTFARDVQARAGDLRAMAESLGAKLGTLTSLADRAVDQTSPRHRPLPMLAPTVTREPTGAIIASHPTGNAVRAPSLPRPERRVVEVDAAVSRPQRAILDALAWFETVARIEQPRRAQVALVAEVSSTSSGFEKNLSTLSTRGLLFYPGPGLVALTDAGRDLATLPDEVDQDELHDTLIRRVSRPQGAILRALLDVYPQALTREETAAHAARYGDPVSPTSSGFEKNLSTLKSLGLLEYPERGSVRAASVLFLEA